MNRRKFLMASGTAIAAGGVAFAIGKSQVGSSSAYDYVVRELRAPLALNPDDRQLIRYATLAVNGHNAQPWKFRVLPEGFEIVPDFGRRTEAVDPDDHHLFASLGCAAENLMIAVASQGRSTALRFDPGDGGKLVIGTGLATARDDGLLAAIPKRQSTRAEYDGQALSPAILSQLASSATIPGVDVAIVTEKPQIRRVRDLVIAANTSQMADRAFMSELKHWLRFNPRDALALRDGLFSGSSGNPSLPEWLGSPLFDLTFKTSAENDKYAKQIDSSAGLAIFCSEKNDPEHWALAGRACQRFALQATALGMKVAFINQPVEEVQYRGELASLGGFAGRRPDILMRFGVGPSLPMSLRRPVEAVLLA